MGNGLCLDTANAGVAGSFHGDQYGDESRCFHSSLWSSSATASMGSNVVLGCYNRLCLSTSRLLVYVKQSNTQTLTIKCLEAGSAGTIQTLSGFSGSLTCP